MSRAPRVGLGVIVLSLVVLRPLWGFAEDHPVEEASQEQIDQARALFERGVEQGQSGDTEAAIAAFQESFELYPHPGTLLNLGLYQLQGGLRVEAFRSLNALLARYGDVISETARAEVNARLAELESALARVTVTSRPEGATLLVDGVVWGQTPLSSPIVREPGRCTFEARLEGFEMAAVAQLLRPGENPPLELVLSPEDQAPPRALLSVASRIEGATVRVDEEPPVELPIRRQVEPGEHSLTVEAQGYAPQTRAVEVEASEEVSLTIDLMPLEEGTTDDEVASAEPVPHSHRPWPYLLLGGLILAGVAASLIGVLLTDDEPQPDWTMRVR